jgi:hypothetical protein
VAGHETQLPISPSLWTLAGCSASEILSLYVPFRSQVEECIVGSPVTCPSVLTVHLLPES